MAKPSNAQVLAKGAFRNNAMASYMDDLYDHFDTFTNNNTILPKIKKIDIDADFDDSEQDTGFTLPDKAVVLDVFVDVTTADPSQTLDVGTDGSGSDDPDGFLDGIDVGTATGIVKGSLASGSQTKGALLREDASGSGVLVPSIDVTSGGETVTYTGSDTTNTMRGSIYIVYFELS